MEDLTSKLWSNLSGVSLGMSILIRIIGSSIGPTIAGMYMQTHRMTVTGFAGYFPSADSYNLIFLTATIISVVSIVFAVILWITIPKHHLMLFKLRV